MVIFAKIAINALLTKFVEKRECVNFHFRHILLQLAG